MMIKNKFNFIRIRQDYMPDNAVRDHSAGVSYKILFGQICFCCKYQFELMHKREKNIRFMAQIL